MFKGLYIESSPYYEYMNKYPVIFLTFKGIGMNSYEETEKEFVSLVSKLYIQKRYVMKKLINTEKRIYEAIMDKTADISEYRNAIANMVEYLYRYHGKQVIVLIDEYGLMNNEYDDAFGFTEKEIKKLLQYYGLELTSDIKNMYDGYNVSGVSLYNPWSIMCYTKRKELDNYWINTSGNELIKTMLSDTIDKNKIEIEKLIQGESIVFTYDDKLTYKDFGESNNLSTILNLLFSSGYLTVKDRKIINNIERIYIGIPNNEVKTYLTKIMLEFISKEGTNTTAFANDVLDALVDYNLVKLESVLNDSLGTISYFDSSESFFHGYMLGVFKNCLDDNSYIVKSNREAESGRYDVMIEQTDKSYGYIFEFKIAGNDEDMERVASKALEQIETKEYYKELVLGKISDIRKVAIVFSKKNCIVR